MSHAFMFLPLLGLIFKDLHVSMYLRGSKHSSVLDWRYGIRLELSILDHSVYCCSLLDSLDEDSFSLITDLVLHLFC